MADLKVLYNTKLSKTEYSISEKINEHTSEVIGMSISELAFFCDVSPSKITKYSKKLGFTGYKELQFFLTRNTERSYTKTTSLEYQREKIMDFFMSFDENKLQEFMNKIQSSDKVYLYGRGPSLKVNEYFVPRLRVATNKNIISNYDEYLFDIDLAKDEPNKLMIILTISGKTKKIHEIIDYCRKRKIETIVISAYSNHILERDADLYINLLSKKEQFDRRIIRGRTMFFLYLEILTQEFMDLNGNDIDVD